MVLICEKDVQGKRIKFYYIPDKNGFCVEVYVIKGSSGYTLYSKCTYDIMEAIAIYRSYK